jgi:hypothetical protein
MGAVFFVPKKGNGLICFFFFDILWAMNTAKIHRLEDPPQILLGGRFGVVFDFVKIFFYRQDDEQADIFFNRQIPPHLNCVVLLR